MTSALPLRNIWVRLPALFRAVVVAFVILFVGQLPPGLFLTIGLKFTPAVPWFLATTVVWLYLWWTYLNGRWWPAATARVRHENLRGNSLPSSVWLWSMFAGGLGMVSVLSGALLTGLVANLPPQAYEAPFDLSPYPPWTVLAFFLNLALVAGVVEEAAFRGYMLSIVERRHGWVVAIVSVAVLFYLVHLSHAYATVAFVPFFMAYSVLHGVLVFLTRSILPSVVLHALGDFAVLPMQYGVVADPLGLSVLGHVLVVMSFGLASALALWHLASIVRHHYREPTA
jgi:membrane protease YdiL (CAAX protease family)